MIKRVLEVAQGPRGALALAAIAVLISLPALRLGLQADDHIFAMQHARGEAPWSLFRATPEQIAESRELGAMAWWTSPGLAVRFLRPLSSLSQALMHELAPSAAWAMTLLNVLVYAACVWLAARVYRRLLPAAGVAALAGVMFAIDDAHAPSVGWIAGRNTILALLGSLATLWFHIRAAEDGKLRDVVLSALALIFALASGEAGTWAFGYLLAYAIALDTRAPRARLIAICPHLIIGAAWAAVYVAGDYGVRGTSWYFELSSPGAVVANGIASVPLTVTSLLGPSLISLSLFAPIWKAQLALLPVAALLVWLVWPARGRGSPTTRFFGLATLLAAVPTSLTVPQDRVLIGAGFGAFGLIASALAQSDAVAGIRHRAARVVLRGCHLWMAGVLFIPMLSAQYGFELATDALRAAARGGQVAVLLNSPIELLANFAQSKDWLEHHGQRPPRPLHQLYAGGSELFVERVSERAIEVTAPRGWGYLPLERIFCRRQDLPRVGDVRRVRGMTVETLEHNEAALPARVRFTFDIPLESTELRWLVWTEARRVVAWRPPSLGQRVRIAPVNVPEAMSAGL